MDKKANDLLHHNRLHYIACAFHIPKPKNIHPFTFEEVVFDFNNVHFYAMNSFIGSTNWDDFLSKVAVNEALE